MKWVTKWNKLVTKWKIVIKVPNHNQYFEKNKLIFLYHVHNLRWKKKETAIHVFIENLIFNMNWKKNWMEGEISMEFSIFHE